MITSILKDIKNNVYAFNKYFMTKSKPTILLKSHIMIQSKPNKGYTNDPFESKVENGKLYGLGSNDAGGALSFINSSIHLFIIIKKS